MNVPRAYPLVIPTSIDEVIVIGGADVKEAERRTWNPKLKDYEFQKFVVDGMNLIEPKVSYDSALPTFLDHVSTKDSFPKVSSDSRLIFGNEIDCFLIEVTKDLSFNFFKSPMKLQQKSGQTSIRTDKDTIYLAGGTDMSRTKISSKTYKFSFSSHEVIELGKLNTPRYFPVMVNEGTQFFIVGGKVKGGAVINSVEHAEFGPAGGKWAELPPMKHARIGHIAWVAKGKLYVMGGASQDKGKPIEEVEVFDIAAKMWSVHPSKIVLT